jgi:hypothetical protein
MATPAPKWLEEIREYWSRMTAQLANEAGQPPRVAPELGFSVLPERPAPSPDPPVSALPALPLPTSPGD